MKYISTNKKEKNIGFSDAVIRGSAKDGALFLPEKFPYVFDLLLKNKGQLSEHDIAFEVLKHYVADDIPEADLQEIIAKAFNFKIPLKEIESNTFVLELFHGPTLAFKDIGARFLAQTLDYISKDKSPVTILVATSGDTGSAVANSFLGLEGINVVVLYPSGKVSSLQEKQFTTLGNNISALEIQGTFDDCQHLVKNAFADEELKYLNLTSANSINIARLLPQSVYYFYAWNMLSDKTKDIVFSVPSGNYGNLTAGLIAAKMGLPVSEFIIGANSNRPVPDYLESGKYEPRPSIETIANAMDVGNPSNFERILAMYDHSYTEIKNRLRAFSFSDDALKKIIKDVKEKNAYILDPHGAAAYGALKQSKQKSSVNGVFLETAHPAKFNDTINKILGTEIEIPQKLKKFASGIKKTVIL